MIGPFAGAFGDARGAGDLATYDPADKGCGYWDAPPGTRPEYGIWRPTGGTCDDSPVLPSDRYRGFTVAGARRVGVDQQHVRGPSSNEIAQWKLAQALAQLGLWKPCCPGLCGGLDTPDFQAYLAANGPQEAEHIRRGVAPFKFYKNGAGKFVMKYYNGSLAHEPPVMDGNRVWDPATLVPRGMVVIQQCPSYTKSYVPSAVVDFFKQLETYVRQNKCLFASGLGPQAVVACRMIEAYAQGSGGGAPNAGAPDGGGLMPKKSWVAEHPVATGAIVVGSLGVVGIALKIFLGRR